MREIIGTYIINNILFWILLVGIILIIIFSREIKHLFGEASIKKVLRKLPKDNYILLNDVTIKSARKVYIIDNLVISKFGIFVIEFVDVSGKVYGDDRSDEWIELNGTKKKYFKNPTHKNHSSIRMLSELLEIDQRFFIPIICFSNDAVICTEIKDKTTKLEILDDCIKNYHKEVLKYGLSEMANKIKEANIIKEKNIPLADKKVDNKKRVIDNKCPKCGSKLVKRNGKYGDFLGCSNYPECKYTREI